MRGGGNKQTERLGPDASAARALRGAATNALAAYGAKALASPKVATVSEPLVAVGVAALSFVSSSVNYGRYRWFLHRIADRYETSPVDAAWQIVSKSRKHRWMRENVARSLRALRDVTDADAEHCLVMLFAEYEERRAMPDRAYKQVAAVLQDCNRELT